MSWWCYLNKPEGGVCTVDGHIGQGGVYRVGGSCDAILSVTYNYSEEFRRAWPEPLFGAGALKLMLDGRTGADTAPLLAEAVRDLGTDGHLDYWRATPGNAGRALDLLRRWAEQHPEGVWRIS